MISFRQRANAAMDAIDSARTPLEKHEARAVGLAVHADLEKHIADDKAMAAFRKAQPQNSNGMFKDLVRDAPVFMVGPAGTKITAPVTLPDGSKAVPNAGYQIVVPAHFVPALIARGFKRANDVLTDQHTSMRAPAIPNGDAA